MNAPTLQHLRRLGLSALLLAVSVNSAFADEVDEIDDDSGKRCINMRLVRSTTIVDDHRIFFNMSGQDAYLNILRRGCRGLKREGRFSYETRSGSLCESDILHILVDTGFGIQEGSACLLGRFQPVSTDDVDAMLNRGKEPTEIREPEGSVPEDVLGEPDEDKETDPKERE